MAVRSKMAWWDDDRVLIRAEDASRYTRLGYWSDTETTSALLTRNADEWPGRTAVADDRGTRLTYGELDDLASRFAGILAVAGVGPGDVVGMQLPNCAEAAIVSYGIERAGGVAVTLVPMFREHELTYIAETCRMRALVTPGIYRDYDYEGLAKRVAGNVASLTAIFSLWPQPGGGTTPLRESLAAASERLDTPLSPNDPCAILFTSGTESTPKGAIHTNNSLLTWCRGTIRALGLGESDGVFMPSPVGHGTGYVNGMRLALLLGTQIVFQDKWDGVAAARTLSLEQCGYVHGATPFVQDLLHAAEAEDLHLAFRYFVSGGTSIPAGLVERARERLGCTLLRLYGQTEAGVLTLNRPWDDPVKRETTDGLPFPGVELEVIVDDGSVAGPGVAGEAAARGPGMCMGFIGDPERARAMLTPDGLMRTGDLVRVDETGHLTVVGRVKETISRGGYKYSPREVEDLVQMHPAVRQAAVVRMADERLGEKGCVFVSLHPGKSLALEDIATLLEERGVARYKWPERLEVVESLPTTPSGKVQKYLLEERLHPTEVTP